MGSDESIEASLKPAGTITSGPGREKPCQVTRGDSRVFAVFASAHLRIA